MVKLSTHAAVWTGRHFYKLEGEEVHAKVSQSADQVSDSKRRGEDGGGEEEEREENDGVDETRKERREEE